MKPKLGIIDKYRPMWEGGKSVEKYNVKVGFKIRMFVVSQITSLRQKNPNLLNQKDIEQLTNMIMELKQDKATIPQEQQTCTLEEYQQFLSEFFNKVDYEDRHETVTIKTTSKFRLMASFIDVLSSWGNIDEEMVKCKKYCQFKAVDIFKALKKGEIPKRGGPKEQIDENNENNNINQESNNNKNNLNNNKNNHKDNDLNNNSNKNYSKMNSNNNHHLEQHNAKQQNQDINKNINPKYNNKSQYLNPNMKRNNLRNQNLNPKTEVQQSNQIPKVNNNQNNIKGNNNNNTYNKINKNNLNININQNNIKNPYIGNNINNEQKIINTNPNFRNNHPNQKDPRMQRRINGEQNEQILNKTDRNNFSNNYQKTNTFVQTNKNKKNFLDEPNINNQNKQKNTKPNQPQQINNNKLRSKNQMNINSNPFNNYHKEVNKNNNYKRQSLVIPSKDGNNRKRTFKGKYRLTTYVPVKYNTVPYFMLIENVRINNDNAKKELKRGKAKNVLDLVLDSLDFLSYVNK